MKRVLIVAASLVLALSALAVCGPYFGVENVGLTANPEFTLGCDISGRIGTSDWMVTVDGWYTNLDVLDNTDPGTLDMDVSLDWRQVATVNQTGSLIYGCTFTVGQTIAFEPLAQGETLADLDLAVWLTALKAEGFVGPLTAWLGCELDLLTGPVGFVPIVGFFVHW